MKHSTSILKQNCNKVTFIENRIILWKKKEKNNPYKICLCMNRYEKFGFKFELLFKSKSVWFISYFATFWCDYASILLSYVKNTIQHIYKKKSYRSSAEAIDCVGNPYFP